MKALLCAIWLSVPRVTSQMMVTPSYLITGIGRTYSEWHQQTSVCLCPTVLSLAQISNFSLPKEEFFLEAVRRYTRCTLLRCRIRRHRAY